MWMIMLFRKLGWKENRYLMAGIYGIIYTALAFLMLTLASYYLKRPGQYNLLISFFLGAAMCIAYFIKLEIFKLKRRYKQ